MTNSIETKLNKDVAIIAFSDCYELADTVAFDLGKIRGIKSTVVKIEDATNLDMNLIDKLVATHRLIVTIENGCKKGQSNAFEAVNKNTTIMVFDDELSLDDSDSMRMTTKKIVMDIIAKL